MDTELKKYKRDTFKRVVAVLLSIICISFMTREALSSIDHAEAADLVYVNFSDALSYDVLGIERDEWQYTTFRNGYTLLLGFLETKMNEFGNGTEKDYEKRLKEYNENLEKETDFYKDRVIFAATDDFTDFKDLRNQGIIEITGVYAIGDTTDENNYSEYYLSFNPDDYLERRGVVREPVLPVSVLQEFKNIKYDNVFYNTETRHVCDEDGNVVEKYDGGYYAFTVNRDELKNQLVSSVTVNSFYSSYEEFYEQYLVSEKRINEHAGTARYFIRNKKGNTITNIEGFGENTKTEEIKNYFGKLGRYSYSQDGAIYLDNGMFYSNTYLDWFTSHSDSFSYNDEEYTVVTHTTMYETETTSIVTAPNAVVPTVNNIDEIYTDGSGEHVTVPETTRVAVSLIRQDNITARDIELYIGFDKNAEYETCHFATVETNIAIAENIIEECLLTCGIFGILLLICIFYLIAITGKRKGSNEIHLYKTDKVFPEIRIALDGGLGFLCGCGIYYFLDVYIDSAMRSFIGLCMLVLIILFFLICLDLLLYLVRHIKNRSLLKNIFIVWLIRKLMKYGKRIKNFFDAQLLYTKELKKTVLIRTAILVGINIVVAGFGIIFVADDEPIGLILVGLLFLFDLYILYRGIRFTAGVDKLFSAVKEMHEGNTDVHIEKNALPDYLYLPAENLQCLSEGIKAAVNEAVKQEKTKTELITNVSHDLKTPLTSIINYVDLMKKCDITDETALSYLQVLSEKSDRLKVLIEDLVEASKASAGALSVEFVCVSCRELINQLMGEFEDSFEAKRLDLILSIPENDVRIKADSKHIYRVLENLFVNVRKYALESTRVYITVSERGDKGIINIKNISAAPLNISADELKERFVRGEQSRTTEGNGLGLSIAENLCTLQNGSLGIEISGDLFSVTVEMERFR